MFRWFLTTLALLSAGAAGAQTCTTSWTSASNGSWSDASRWSSGVPTAADTACVTQGGTYTVSGPTGAISVGALVLGGANGAQTLTLSQGLTLGAIGTIRANGVLEWANEYLNGGTLTNEGLVRLTGATTNRGVRGETTRFRNEGTVEFTDDGRFYVYSGARVENSSLWHVTDAGDLWGASGAGTFANAGTLRKSGAGLSQVVGGGLVFENAGAVDVRGGEVRFERPSTHTGVSFAVAEESSVVFASGGVTFAGRTTGAPVGVLRVQDGFSVASGAVWDLGGTGMEWTNEYLNGGTLTNEGLVRLAGATTNRGVRGETTRFRNEGTVEFTDDGRFYVYSGARVENSSLWHVTDAGDLWGASGAGTFANAGTLRKSGAGLSQVVGGGLVFENAGAVDVRGGEVRFERPSTHTGVSFAVAEDAEVVFASGSDRFEGTTTGAPAGTIRIQNGFTTAAGAVWNVSGTGMEWANEHLNDGTLTNRGLVRLTGATTSRGVRNAGTWFRNEGTVEFSGTGRFYVYSGARAENASLWDVTDGGDFWGASGEGAFVNEAEATLRKSGGADNPTQIVGGGLVFESAGTVEARIGTIQFERPATHSDARIEAASGAEVVFASGSDRFEGTTTGAPAGTIRIQNGFTTAAGAVWNVSGTGMEWANEHLNDGTLTNRGLVRLTGATTSRGVRNAGTWFRNEGTVEFSGTGRFYVYSGARVENRSLWRITDAGDIWGSSGTGVFVNSGTLQKSGEGLSQVVGGSLSVENTGEIDVQEGEVRFERPSAHTGASFAVAEDAMLLFAAGAVTFLGRTTGAPEGVLRIQTGFAVADGAVWDVGGTGVEWSNEYLNAGSLINEGLVRLTGATTSRGARGETAWFRNRGTVEFSSTGRFYLYSGAQVENSSLWRVTEGGGLWGSSGTGTFVNTAEGTFQKSGGADVTARIVGGGLAVENAGTFEVLAGTLSVERPFRHREGAVIQGDGAFNVNTQFVNEGDTAPGAPMGSLDWGGLFAPEATSALQIEIEGTTPGSGYDQLLVGGAAQLNGQLVVDVLDAYTPTTGDTFTILNAASLMGGFDLVGLTNADANVSLYPDFGETALTLTASEGIPTVSGDLAVAPEEVLNGSVVELTLTGTGFAPDVTLRLVCTDCDDTSQSGDVTGLVRRITPTEIVILFDLTVAGSSGLYDVVVTDPRGGEARASLEVTDGPPVLSVEALDAQASEENLETGLFLVRLNRPLRKPITVPFTLGGSAQLFADYVPDVLGGSLLIPAGRDSVVVSIFPIGDEEDEPTETVILSMTFDNPQPAPLSASLQLLDGPPTTAFGVYASTPTTVGNLGPVTITIGGQGLTDAATVRLTGGGKDLEAVRVKAEASGTVLNATFIMTGQPVGFRNLVIAGGSGESRTLENALIVEPAIFPDVYVQVLAPPRVPRTRERTYTVLLENRGNVSVQGHAALSGIPPDVDWRVEDDAANIVDSFSTWRDVAPTIRDEATGTYILSLPEITLAPRETRRVTLVTAIGTPQTLRLVAAWLYRR